MVEENFKRVANFLLETYQEAVKTLHEQKAFYPKMMISDVIKQVFQMVYGCGHMISSKESSLAYIKKELKEVTKIPPRLFEYIGGGFWRVFLSPQCLNEQTVEAFNDLFVASSQITCFFPKDQYCDLLDLIKEYLIENKWYQEDDINVQFYQYMQSEHLMMHHSQVFKKNYDPHYRVVHQQFIDSIKILFNTK